MLKWPSRSCWVFEEGQFSYHWLRCVKMGFCLPPNNKDTYPVELYLKMLDFAIFDFCHTTECYANTTRLVSSCLAVCLIWHVAGDNVGGQQRGDDWWCREYESVTARDSWHSFRHPTWPRSSGMCSPLAVCY